MLVSTGIVYMAAIHHSTLILASFAFYIFWPVSLNLLTNKCSINVHVFTSQYSLM